MAREESLRALIAANVRDFVRGMRSAGRRVREVGEESEETAAKQAEMASSMVGAQASAGLFENRMEELKEEVQQTTGALGSLAAADAGVAASFVQASSTAKVLEERIDEVGDEAKETTAEVTGLRTALASMATVIGRASVNIGPFNTKVRYAVLALPLLIALVGAATTAFAGLAVAVVAATGALAALFAGGILVQLDQMERHMASIENRMDAMSELASMFADSLEEVTEPLQTIASQEAALNILSGMLQIAGDLANSAAYLQSQFGAVGERLDEIFWAEEAQGIAELEKLIIELLPYLERLTRSLLRGIPDLLRWLRTETDKLLPSMGSFINTIIVTAKELTELGGVLMRIVLPPLSLLLFMINPLLDALSEVPPSLYAAATAFTLTSVALYTYSGGISLAAAGTWAFNAALAVTEALLAPFTAGLSGATLAIAALAGVTAGAITYFDAWNDTINMAIGVWNFAIETLEFLINSFIILSNAIWDLQGPLVMMIPFFGLIVTAIANWEKIMWALKKAIDAVRNIWNLFVQDVLKYIEPIQRFFETLNEAMEAEGGVDLSSARIEPRSGPSTRQRGGRDAARSRAETGSGGQVAERAQEFRQQGEGHYFDFRHSNIGSSSERDIERAVTKALKYKKSRSSDR